MSMLYLFGYFSFLSVSLFDSLFICLVEYKVRLNTLR